MQPSHSFAPVARGDARLLILGSLPGAMSLAAQQYYAQPHNGFWPIMGALAGALPDLPYAWRLERLMEKRIALWDVCASAERAGSLDTAIRFASVIPNDFASLLAAHPAITLIAFNGAKAAELYRRLVLPALPGTLQAIPHRTLPSTSPAHASLRLPEKLLRWREALITAMSESGLVLMKS